MYDKHADVRWLYIFARKHLPIKIEAKKELGLKFEDVNKLIQFCDDVILIYVSYHGNNDV